MASHATKRAQVMSSNPLISARHMMTVIHGNQGTRDFESARTVWLGLAQVDHCERDEHECEQRSDVGEVGGVADVNEARGDSNDRSGDPGDQCGVLKRWMDGGEELRQQAIA